GSSVGPPSSARRSTGSEPSSSWAAIIPHESKCAAPAISHSRVFVPSGHRAPKPYIATTSVSLCTVMTGTRASGIGPAACWREWGGGVGGVGVGVARRSAHLARECGTPRPAPVHEERVVDLRERVDLVDVGHEEDCRLRLADRDDTLGLRPAEDGRVFAHRLT